MMAYEMSESARNNFGKFICQFQLKTNTLVRKIERKLIRLYWQNVSLLFNQTCLHEGLLCTHTHTHTHTYIYIYIYIYISLRNWRQNFFPCIIFQRSMKFNSFSSLFYVFISKYTYCCIVTTMIHIQLYTYICGNIINNDERTHFFRKIYHSHYSKGLRKGYVWEVSWRLNKRWFSLQHLISN